VRQKSVGQLLFIHVVSEWVVVTAYQIRKARGLLKQIRGGGATY